MLASAPGEVERQPRVTVYETVMAVQDGEADRAVVPIENSLEGGVAATLDALAGEADRVRIAAEVVHPIHHFLLAGRPMELADVERVLSHPQATAQCARFLRERLQGAERVAATSTAEAVRRVGDSPEPWAALGSRLSAQLYGGTVRPGGAGGGPPRQPHPLRLAGSRRRGRAAPGRPNQDLGGLLGLQRRVSGGSRDVLREFSDRGINLTKIESRPRRVRLGHYMFFADLDGNAEQPPVGGLSRLCAAAWRRIRVLGSYPAG